MDTFLELNPVDTDSDFLQEDPWLVDTGLELGQAALLVQSHKFAQDVVPDDNTPTRNPETT